MEECAAKRPRLSGVADASSLAELWRLVNAAAHQLQPLQIQKKTK